MAEVGSDDPPREEYDVVIVGGGPAGCSAGLFTARYGLDTVVFDRGRSSIKQCAHLENYLGFPAGISIEMLYELMHDHATEAGCEIIPEMVETVERAEEEVGQADERPGFVVETQDGRRVTARRVIAAARYDGTYLRPLGEEAMFETYEHDGESHERFDRSYADADGATPVEGLYVASPAAETDRQAIVAAGRGARVGLAVVDAVRREAGFPEAFSQHYDWMRRDAALDDEWRDRETWREWVDEHVPGDHGLTDERLVELREREIDRRLATYLSDDEIESRADRAQDRLLSHIDDERILEYAREIDGELGTPEADD